MPIMKLCNRLAVFAVGLVGLLVPFASHAFFFGPSNYDECIQERLEPGMSDIQSKAIIGTCRREFPAPETEEIRDRYQCANGSKFSIKKDTASIRELSYERAAELSALDVFDGYSLSFIRVKNKLDIINSEWNAIGQLKISIANALPFSVRDFAIGFSEDGEKCSDMRVVLQCNRKIGGPSHISSGRTGSITCPPPPVDRGFNYCIRAVNYWSQHQATALAVMMGTECNIDK